MRRERADRAMTAGPRDVRQLGDALQIDQRLRPGQSQLHHRNEALTAGENFRDLALPEQQQRFLDRMGAEIIERCRDHAGTFPFERGAIAFQSFSGRSGMSRCVTPNGASASITALTTAGVEPMVPASPTPLTPSGLTVVSVTVRSHSKGG